MKNAVTDCNMKLFNVDGTQTQVDDDIYERMLSIKWRILGGYVIGWIDKRNIKLHRFIMGDEHDTIDHVDRDKLNNQRSNLRFATQSQNCANIPKRGIYVGTTSIFKGVNYSKRRRYYISRITVWYKTVMIHKSASQEECAFAYNVAALRLYGDFAQLNNVDFYSKEIETKVLTILKIKYGK